MTLAGSVSVITGASSGIGEAAAREFAARGSHVLLLARRIDRLDAIVEEIGAAGGKATAYSVDLSDARAIAGVASRITDAHGSPDILVNNAGAGRWKPILETSAEEAAAMVAVPYLAAFNLTRELLPGMLRRRSGRVVNVTSVGARLAWPRAVAYIAARSAMEGFTDALRADLHGSGIGVTLAMFGTVESPYWEHNPGSRERLPKQAARFPTLQPSAVAAMIATSVEKGSRTIVAPGAFRLLFLLNSLFPGRIEASMAA
jgi:short-subunit dehydrogenase